MSTSTRKWRVLLRSETSYRIIITAAGADEAHSLAETAWEKDCDRFIPTGGDWFIVDVEPDD